MKQLLLIIIVVCSLSNLQAQTVTKIWETKAIFEVPESVLYDDSVIYVSNINGKPTEKNELGYISRMNNKGEVLELKWITGLNAPKGMGIINEKLYVTDIDRVAIIDRTKGELIQFIDFPEAKFLNDISISDKGVVAVSDLLDQTIYFIEKEKIVDKIKNEQLNRVNGLYWDQSILYAGTQNIVYRINVDAKEIEPFILETGGIDGLEKLDDHRFVISDWSGKVQLISNENDPVVLFDTTPDGINAADLDIIPSRKIILVPTFYGNTVTAYQIIE